MASNASDPAADRLARLFLEHPAWISAATHLDPRATSAVYFAHRPAEVWQLAMRDGRARLLPGAAPDPDLVFRFTPAAVECLEAVDGGIGSFAVALFELMLVEDPERHVDLRIAATFARLARRGYLRLLVAAGPPVVAFGLSHGVGSLAALRRFVARIRTRDPADWETGPNGR